MTQYELHGPWLSEPTYTRQRRFLKEVRKVMTGRGQTSEYARGWKAAIDQADDLIKLHLYDFANQHKADITPWIRPERRNARGRIDR